MVCHQFWRLSDGRLENMKLKLFKDCITTSDYYIWWHSLWTAPYLPLLSAISPAAQPPATAAVAPMAMAQESPKVKTAPAVHATPVATLPTVAPIVHPVAIAPELPIWQASESQDRTPCVVIAMIARAKKIGTRELKFKNIVWTVSSHKDKLSEACHSLNVSTTPITAMGCRQCLPLCVVQLKGKHCQNTPLL